MNWIGYRPSKPRLLLLHPFRAFTFSLPLWHCLCGCKTPFLLYSKWVQLKAIRVWNSWREWDVIAWAFYKVEIDILNPDSTKWRSIPLQPSKFALRFCTWHIEEPKFGYIQIMDVHLPKTNYHCLQPFIQIRPTIKLILTFIMWKGWDTSTKGVKIELLRSSQSCKVLVLI